MNVWVRSWSLENMLVRLQQFGHKCLDVDTLGAEEVYGIFFPMSFHETIKSVISYELINN